MLISVVQPTDSVTHTYTFFFTFFSLPASHRVLTGVPCAIQDLALYPFMPLLLGGDVLKCLPELILLPVTPANPPGQVRFARGPSLPRQVPGGPLTEPVADGDLRGFLFFTLYEPE